MSRREDRDGKIEGWLEHLQGWKASGEALSRYARARGIAPSSMYHWRNVLRREGRWPEGGNQMQRRACSQPMTSVAVPLRFARVKMDERSGCSRLTVRIVLTNGRRAEIDLGDAHNLSEVLSMLERLA